MIEKCKRCLLYEAGETDVYSTVKDYIDNLDDDIKTDGAEYQKRLAVCRECESLISGMCLKCGCYVEVRAVLRDKHCPDFDNKKW